MQDSPRMLKLMQTCHRPERNLVTWLGGYAVPAGSAFCAGAVYDDASVRGGGAR